MFFFRGPKSSHGYVCHPPFVQVPFFTVPPESAEGDGGGAEGAKAAEAVFVEGFGKNFDVEAGDAEVSCKGRRRAVVSVRG